jgi:glycosyltransferase involved in cell wall biosynthesis
MLQGHDLIYFGPGQWQGLWRNRHQLLTRFARHNRVLYVEPQTDFAGFRDLWRTGRLGWRTIWQEFRRDWVEPVQPNLYIYQSPKGLPVSGRFPLDCVTWQVWLAALKLTLRRLRFQRPIVWLSRPEMGRFLGHFRESLTIYHVVDEYTAYQTVSGEEAGVLRESERALMQRADLVIVVSPQLLEVKRTFNSQTYLVPNGVNLAAFQAPAPVPDDLQSISAPRLIYAGLIGARLDLKLLLALMRRRPDWSLVLIGQENPAGTEGKTEELRRLPNTHYLGLKPVQQVPAYLLACSVCVLPYAGNREAHFLDPLKLYEGLAAGLPIVATPIPAIRPYGRLVRLATGIDEFEAEVEAALAEGRSIEAAQKAAQRQAVAADHTWDARVEQVSALIEAKLGRVGKSNVDEAALSSPVR